MEMAVKVSLSNRRDIEDAAQHNRLVSQKEWESDGYYRVDRHDASGYLSMWPKWRMKVREYFRSLKEQGERAVYADVCGRASGASLGADKSYSFSLQPLSTFWYREDKELRVRGDIFSSKDFYSFVNLLRSNGDNPGFVTFEPIVGLEGYTPWESAKGLPRLHADVTYQRLLNNLEKMFEILKPGGFIYLDRPFQLTGLKDFFMKVPQEQNDMTLSIKQFCKEKGHCSVEIERSICGPKFLIRKHLSRKKKTKSS
jgi:hypothetical protein